MKICIIRHGETDWVKAGRIQGREDIPLNEMGIQQSEKVAQYLENYQWHEIITSPLSRTKQTAGIIAEKIGITTIHDEIDFIERDYGKASGLSAEVRKATYPDGNYEDMEDWNILQKRVFGALSKYIQKYNDKNIIIVSHGGSINSILATLSNHEIGSGKTRLKTACISMLEIIDDKIEIIFYNKEADELLFAKE